MWRSEERSNLLEYRSTGLVAGQGALEHGWTNLDADGRVQCHPTSLLPTDIIESIVQGFEKYSDQENTLRQSQIERGLNSSDLNDWTAIVAERTNLLKNDSHPLKAAITELEVTLDKARDFLMQDPVLQRFIIPKITYDDLANRGDILHFHDHDTWTLIIYLTHPHGVFGTLTDTHVAVEKPRPLRGEITINERTPKRKRIDALGEETDLDEHWARTMSIHDAHRSHYRVCPGQEAGRGLLQSPGVYHGYPRYKEIDNGLKFLRLVVGLETTGEQK